MVARPRKSSSRKHARDVAQDRGSGVFWIDHAEIVEADAEWLAGAERLTLWNVGVPPGFLARLPRLWWLDIRGGTARDLEVSRSCAGLRYLCVNQVRGLLDLELLATHVRLELLSLYGLAQVRAAPSLRALKSLRRLEVGQMKALGELEPLLEAPQLRELLLHKVVLPTERDVARINRHPSLEAFSWTALDVPARISEPVIRAIPLAPARSMHPEEWFDGLRS
jgi:hypothetical protein